MIIGLDFDNTIVCYDTIFHTLACEKGLISHQVPVHKIAIRDYLRKAGKEELWTQLQGEVYGTHMERAEPFIGVAQFILEAQKAGHTVYIVSHKTKHPFAGPAYDLHQPARQWIETNLDLASENVHLELTKERKLKRIASLKCDFFIDDLPEILMDPLFPSSSQGLLFDPDAIYEPVQYPDLEIHTSWQSIQTKLENCVV